MTRVSPAPAAVKAGSPKEAAPAGPGRSAPFRWIQSGLGLLSILGALCLAAAFCWRPISSFDIGYHLAYGEHFFKTGQIVQTNEFMYTRLNPQDTGGVGPGCWYEGDTYHFVNANWLTQVVLAAVNNAAGTAGLCWLQFGVSFAIFLVLLAIMWRGGLSRLAIAAGLMLVGLCSYERLNLRPEVFGYLLLIGQFGLLLSRRLRVWHIAGLLVLQVLAANVHSYFLLGIVLTGAFLADALLRLMWAHAKQAPNAELAGRAKMLAIALGAVLLASFVNPWTWRGAVMPVQTVLFLAKHHIGGEGGLGSVVHPWATIGEFTTPFLPGIWHTKATYAFLVVLGLAGASLLAALVRRRWDLVFVLAGMTYIAVQMRRNIAPGSMILVPAGMIAVKTAWEHFRPRLPTMKPPAAAWTKLGAAVVLLAASGLFCTSVAQNRFYFNERRPWRFGTGLSVGELPIQAADFIRREQPPGRLFCDYMCSSNLTYWTGYQVPVLTNTWAYPPYVMQWVIQACAGQRSFDPIVKDYQVGTVVLLNSSSTAPLMKALAGSKDWAVVDISANYVVFLRRSGPTADLAARLAIDPRAFDVPAFVARVRETDPVGVSAVNTAAWTLFRLGWGNAAIQTWHACLADDPGYYDAMGSLASSLAMRGTMRLQVMQELVKRNDPAGADKAKADAVADWDEAESLFRRALEINPDYTQARQDYNLLKQQRQALDRGVILLPETPQ